MKKKKKKKKKVADSGYQFSIEYCVPWDYSSHAVRVAQEIMVQYQYEMESLVFIPGDKGIFDVKVDGTLVYSKHTTGRFPDPGEITSELQKTII